MATAAAPVSGRVFSEPTPPSPRASKTPSAVSSDSFAVSTISSSTATGPAAAAAAVAVATAAVPPAAKDPQLEKAYNDLMKLLKHPEIPSLETRITLAEKVFASSIDSRIQWDVLQNMLGTLPPEKRDSFYADAVIYLTFAETLNLGNVVGRKICITVEELTKRNLSNEKVFQGYMLANRGVVASDRDHALRIAFGRIAYEKRLIGDATLEPIDFFAALAGQIA